jgi:hypothetical protein
MINSPGSGDYILIKDLSLWVEFYREGILADDYQHEGLDFAGGSIGKLAKSLLL